jgi:hypothetical protein
MEAVPPARTDTNVEQGRIKQEWTRWHQLSIWTLESLDNSYKKIYNSQTAVV